jgi:gamma-D-glutamyl-L-lysine dipeptidyl-peptidase
MSALFALVRVPIAPLQKEPLVQGAQLSQALFGHPLLVVESDGDWHRLRGITDGYEGWTHGGYVRLIEVEEVPDAGAIAPYSERTFDPRGDDAGGADGAPAPALAGFGGDGVSLPSLSLGCTVIAGARRLRLPLGAYVAASQSVLGGDLVPLGERGVLFPRDGDALVRTASRWFEGTPYQWGGITPWGADCSGLVQTVFGLHGVELPRDAWMQALVGDPLDPDPTALAAGDLLFFSDREDERVTHVALSTGDGRIAHLALGRGGWAVDELEEPEDEYCERLRGRLVGARRVL